MAASTQTRVAIVGAGPAGLAVGASLRAVGVDAFVMLERSEAVGASWRGHYARLHLHTVKQHSALPYRAFPTHAPTYPSRQQVVDYLDDYARAFRLAPRFGTEVEAIVPDGDGWRVSTTRGEVRARAVVVAMGYSGVPRMPALDDAGFAGEVLHTSRYRDGRAYRGRHVVVVGLGNSGGEIALDLFEHGARVTLAVRSPVHVMPREFLGLPAQLHGIAAERLPRRVADRLSAWLLARVVGDLSSWGLRRPEMGPVEQVLRKGRIPLIDIGTVALIKQGAIRVVPSAVRRLEGPRTVTFEDGTRLSDVDVVLCATGYAPALERVLPDADSLTDARGYPTRLADDCARPGLYFVGYRNPITGQLRDIAHEAQRVAAHLARRG